MTSLRCGGVCLALLSIGFLGSSDANADTISTWNGGSGNWSAAGQWTPARVPNNTATQAYDVTIGSGGATLDISPTINSLTLDGGLGEGYDKGHNTTLTVNGNATVNGTVAGRNGFVGWLDSLVVGRNFTNNGYMQLGNMLSVSGNMNNSGTLILIGDSGPMSGFGVGGTLVNTGSLQWGSGDGVDSGPRTFLDGIVNKGSIFIGPGASVSGGGVNDIPKGASWFVAGQFSGFSQLTGIEGSLDVEGTLDREGINVLPLTLGSLGNTIHNSSLFTIGSSFGTSVVNVIGNLSNTGDIEIAAAGVPSRRQLGSSTLNVSGTLTNQAIGTLNVNLSQAELPSTSALNVQNLVNRGTVNFNAGTASTARFLENRGTLNVWGDGAGDIGSLTVGTLKPVAGVMTVRELGGLLTVGSTAAPAGFTGYFQSANGVLDAAGGELDVRGPVT